MLNGSNVDGVLSLFIGITAFIGFVHIPGVEAFVKQYAVWVFAGSLLIFVQRKRIIDMILRR